MRKREYSSEVAGGGREPPLAEPQVAALRADALLLAEVGVPTPTSYVGIRVAKFPAVLLPEYQYWYSRSKISGSVSGCIATDFCKAIFIRT